MNHSVTHQRLKRAGFTLVELMAVIAVMLLVLKLLLLPDGAQDSDQRLPPRRVGLSPTITIPTPLR